MNTPLSWCQPVIPWLIAGHSCAYEKGRTQGWELLRVENEGFCSKIISTKDFGSNKKHLKKPLKPLKTLKTSPSFHTGGGAEKAAGETIAGGKVATGGGGEGGEDGDVEEEEGGGEVGVRSCF